MILKRTLSLVTLLVTTSSVSATELLRILDAKEAPPGVVIEIVSGDRQLLASLLPELRDDIDKVRAKFPELAIAIVSHGSEQFMMTSDQAVRARKTHSIVESLVDEHRIDFHVCGTHAGWYGVMPEDFPSYVDVSPTGPAQINDYEELGYELIVLP